MSFWNDLEKLRDRMEMRLENTTSKPLKRDLGDFHKELCRAMKREQKRDWCMEREMELNEERV